MKTLSQVFRRRHVILPVIHAETVEGASRNAHRAYAAGCDGVFLINHGIPAQALLALHAAVVFRLPGWWVGVNLQGVRPAEVFAQLGPQVSGVWLDDAGIDEGPGQTQRAAEIREACGRSRWRGLYFGGVAYGRPAADPGAAARLGSAFVDVVTTSGPAGDPPAALDKARRMRAALAERPLAIASGLTPDNVADYLPFADCVMMATGVSSSFRELDPALLERLVIAVRAFGLPPSLTFSTSTSHRQPNPANLSHLVPSQDGGPSPNQVTPVALAPALEPRGGVVYLDPTVDQADLLSALRVMGVRLGETAYALYLAEATQPGPEGYFQQVRIVGHDALRFVFSMPTAEIGKMSAQPMTVAELVWQFIQKERRRWDGVDLEGRCGGDGEWRDERLGFAFMVEQGGHAVYRVWSRGWFSTK